MMNKRLLHPYQIQHLRELRSQGWTLDKLAIFFKVGSTTICKFSSEKQFIKNREEKCKSYFKHHDHALEHAKKYRTENKIIIKERKAKAHQLLKLEIMNYYCNGQIQCACCHEKQIEFLTIDHINNDGQAHRKTLTTGFYQWIKNNNFPKGFQVLCMNCNWAKSLFGKCPHVMVWRKK